MKLATQLEAVAMSSLELVVAFGIAAASIMIPIRDRFLQLVALKFLVRPVFDGTLDSNIEALAGFHEVVAELIGLLDREPSSSADGLLHSCESSLTLPTLKEYRLWKKACQHLHS